MMDSDRWEWAASLLPSKSTTTTTTTSTSSINKKEEEKRDSKKKETKKKKKTTTNTNNMMSSRYETDMEQAFAMQQQQQQQRRAASNSTSPTRGTNNYSSRRLLTVDDIRLGMTGLEKAGDLARSGDLEEAMKLYELSLTVLIRYLHSPDNNDSSAVDLLASSGGSSDSSEYPCDRSSVETLVTMALSDAESVKATLMKKKQQGQQQNHPSESTTREQSSNNDSIKTDDDESSNFSWLKDLLSSVCKQTAPNNSSTTGKSSTSKNVTATARSTATKKPTPSTATGLSGRKTTRSTKTKQVVIHSKQPLAGNAAASSTCGTLAGGIISQPGRRRPQHAAATAAAPRRLPAASATPTAAAGLAANSELRQIILTDFLVPPHSLQETTWSDIAGLEHVKQSLQETAILPLVRPDLFTGLRRPQNILLYGPPGTGKTLLVRAVAHESGSSALFCCSAASLTSKWMGQAEKLTKLLFQVAAEAAPSLIFLDEVDALLSSRKSDGGEHEASRRLKTEFMVQMEGISSGGSNSSNDHVLVLACTNCPWDVDSAVLRRFPRRIHVPLPDVAARTAMLEKLLEKAGKHSVTKRQLTSLVKRLAGFSCSDISAIASEASFGPIRDLDMHDVRAIPASKVRPISMQDFDAAMKNATKSVTEAQLRRYQEWQQEQGVSSAA